MIERNNPVVSDERSQGASFAIRHALDMLTEGTTVSRLVKLQEDAQDYIVPRDTIEISQFGILFWRPYNWVVDEYSAKNYLHSLGKSEQVYDFMLNQMTTLHLPKIWGNLVKKSGRGVRKAFKDAMNAAGDKSASLDEIADGIAIQNAQFFGLTNQLIGLVVVFGKDIEKFIKPSMKSKVPSLPAVLAMGEMFGGVAQDADEIYRRWQQLFPASEPIDPEIKQNTAFGFLTRYHAFEQMHGDEKAICGAIQLTRMMYQACGQVLRAKIQKWSPASLQ